MKENRIQISTMLTEKSKKELEELIKFYSNKLGVNLSRNAFMNKLIQDEYNDVFCNIRRN